MPGFLIRFRWPDGRIDYWPPGFGFQAHAHVSTIREAERFPTREKAAGMLQGYINPGAFWNSERKHQQLMHEQFRRVRCEVIPAPWWKP